MQRSINRIRRDAIWPSIEVVKEISPKTRVAHRRPVEKAGKSVAGTSRTIPNALPRPAAKAVSIVVQARVEPQRRTRERHRTLPLADLCREIDAITHQYPVATKGPSELDALIESNSADRREALHLSSV